MKKIILLGILVSSLFSFEELNKDNFHQKIEGKNVIIDFHAPWCPPCKILAVNLEEFDVIKHDNVEVFKVNIDNEQELSRIYKVRRLPTIILFKDGEMIKQYAGIKTADELLEISKNDFK
ncbi:thioredoxin family protein [Arcobacter porcinus]|uniref:Thioredoxin n=1 Tax=Arcobacter porcinus TaxID=1935204 RepID=A0A5C2HK44_9BACT|nr:thioredoxin family protein [Arcobacter porcinus]OCL83116.1 Thioredoxin [Arcobacter porcinus]OCL88165.1 Thioredoxin [Arcobacter porcinus]OCL94517.1 Thioredoxin [Aliarcobacter thereius]QEP41491.1 thioredoxin [Arcobacter porcinus]